MIHYASHEKVNIWSPSVICGTRSNRNSRTEIYWTRTIESVDCAKCLAILAKRGLL